MAPVELTQELRKSGQTLEWNGHGYQWGWRSNIFGTPRDVKGRWETHPEEYTIYPVESVRKGKY